MHGWVGGRVSGRVDMMQVGDNGSGREVRARVRASECECECASERRELGHNFYIFYFLKRQTPY